MRIRTTVSTPLPDEPSACGHLSPASQMRLRLAASRLKEMREMNLGEAHPATLILAVERLGNALEDTINLVLEAHPDSGGIV